jgi:hypothetical protein
LRQFQALDAKKLQVKIPFRGIATGKEDLVMLTGQIVKVRDKKKEGTAFTVPSSFTALPVGLTQLQQRYTSNVGTIMAG